MPNKAGLIARMFGRSQNTVVAKLYTHALGQPLMVHPRLGEQLLGAYLDGAVETTPPQEPVVPAEETTARIAVINVSGGLVNRPMPDICGSGPLSYAEIRSYFDAALNDSNISAIVLRMDSPGGMAAGCFDLTDYIYAARGTKPIVAQIDDNAYSACYALAAACDRIQVTRTGGGGSIGVYTYHVDLTAANAKAGVRIDYIYAGEKKLDGNPDMPLSDTARTDMQRTVDSIYSLFASSVAKYRGMSLDAVIATQAGCYSGAALVAAGLADSVGTLEDLLVELSAPANSKPAVPEGAENGDEAMPDTTDLQATEETAQALAQTNAALAAANEKVVKLETSMAMRDAVSSLKLPDAVKLALQSAAVTDVLTVEKVPQRIESAQAIVDLCAAAKLESCAADYVKRGVSVEVARAELQAAVADTKDEIVTAHPQGEDKQKTTAQKLDPTEIYGQHNNRNHTRSNAK